MLKKILQTNLFFIFITFLYLVFSPVPVYSLCDFSWFYKPNLVIARVGNQELLCEPQGVQGVVNDFKKLIVLKGTVEDNFKIITPVKSGECPSRIRVEPGLIELAPYECFDCPSTPKFEKGKIYIMSVYPVDSQMPSEYSLSGCDEIFEEIKGILDPKVLFYFLRVLIKPILAFGFVPVLALSYFLGNVFPLENLIIFGVSIVITIALYGLLIYVLFRIIRFTVKLLKVKLRR